MYMAPEVNNAKLYDEKENKENRGYNELCDMWSVGAIAYVLLVGKFHLKDEDQIAQRKEISKWIKE